MCEVMPQTYMEKTWHPVLALRSRPGFPTFHGYKLFVAGYRRPHKSVSTFTYKYWLQTNFVQILLWLQVLLKELPRKLYNLSSGSMALPLAHPQLVLPQPKPSSGPLPAPGSRDCGTERGCCIGLGTPGRWAGIQECDMRVTHSPSIHRLYMSLAPPALPEESHFSGRKEGKEKWEFVSCFSWPTGTFK